MSKESKIFYRCLELERSTIVDENRTITCSFSSEEPYERFFGVEVLDHSDGSVNLSRLKTGAALLWNHNHDDQIGVVESAEIIERKLIASVRFSRNSDLATEIFEDIKDGIIRNVSIGYIIDKMVEEETPEGKTIYRATAWTPYELSIVSVPADATVGIGRSEGFPEGVEIVKIKKEKHEDSAKKIVIIK